MISLETLSTLLSVGEAELIEELILALLASPQLALFFEKFPGLKKAMLRDVPRWKAEINAELKATPVPENLTQEFHLFQRVQLLSHADFNHQLTETLDLLARLPSPFIEEANRLIQHNDAHQLSSAQHTLFLQRWRLSLTLQTLTLNEQLLEQQRERLMAELQQRMALSGQLAPVLSDNDEAAAGRLWDMSKASRQHGDYQLMLQYGDFLAQQPELMKLAQQLAAAARRNRCLHKMRQWRPFIIWCMNRILYRKRSAVFIKAMMCCVCCHQSWRR